MLGTDVEHGAAVNAGQKALGKLLKLLQVSADASALNRDIYDFDNDQEPPAVQIKVQLFVPG